MLSPAQRLADDYVQRAAELDPVKAGLDFGIDRFDDRLTDYSPAGAAARAAHWRSTLVALAALRPVDGGDQLAAEVLRERVEYYLADYTEGSHLRPLRIINSPFERMRQAFDLMPQDSDEQWARIALRMARVPKAAESALASLREGLSRGVVAARRQALAVAEQTGIWGGADSRVPAYFTQLISAFQGDDAALQQRLEQAANAANRAYAEVADFLRTDYAPNAAEADGVGRERYISAAREFLGASIDVEEVYAWGWDELRRIQVEQRVVAQEILPGATLEEAVLLLDTDPERAIIGEDELRSWLQRTMDQAIAALDAHFDMPGEVRRIQAMIAPPGGAAAMYYTPPSEDFSRPGQTWYPTMGETRFATWREVTTAYHEGVPGHHLQITLPRATNAPISGYQRSLFISGHGEGWALYAERLMDELGFFTKADDRLGYLAAQAFRAARIVVDIGLHCGFPLPRPEADRWGTTWSAESARAFLQAAGGISGEFARSEIVRYLGWPGQAISYKLGERVWLDGRHAAQNTHGSAFDLKAFHWQALRLGGMGLDQLSRRLPTLGVATADN